MQILKVMIQMEIIILIVVLMMDVIIVVETGQKNGVLIIQVLIYVCHVAIRNMVNVLIPIS